MDTVSSGTCANGELDAYAVVRDAVTNADFGFKAGGPAQARVWTPWHSPTNGQARVVFRVNGEVPAGTSCAPSTPAGGVAMAAYEYQRYQAGAQPLFTALRFPGQYHDAETDTFENWNRYYEPSIGRYLQPEPLLPDPSWVRNKVAQGLAAPPYAYAANNPVYFLDPDGNTIIIIPLLPSPNLPPDASEWDHLLCALMPFACNYEPPERPPGTCADPRAPWKRKKEYLCTATCQANGAQSGAYYVHGTSARNCAEATLAAKASVPRGQYPRHCSCSDTNGFRGVGHQCESHRR